MTVREYTSTDKQFEVARATKRKMDRINYDGLYSGYSAGELFFCEPERIGEDSKIVRIKPEEKPRQDTLICKVYDELDKGTKIGVVSNGVHGLDLIYRYFPSVDMLKDISWINSRVMLVYEAPANNLDCSSFCNFDKSKVVEFIKNYDDMDLSQRLTTTWWRLDQKDSESTELLKEPYKLLEKSPYVSFPLFLISQLGICNLYITNYCRFELFDDKNEKGEITENFIGWKDAMDKEATKDVMEKAFNTIFKAEVEEFEPDIILATANPYNKMVEEGKGYATIGEKQYKMIKIIHPANRMAKEYITTVNYCKTVRDLYKCGIIDKDMAYKRIEEFINI